MQAPEIELKLPVADPTAFQSRLPALGFHLDTPRTFEQNTLYDTPNRDLRARKQLLRLRQYGQLWTVTHKRQPDKFDAADTLRYKVRIETETLVSDGLAAAEIFTQLGYGPVFRYEKYRTEWSETISETAAGHLVVDETPIGTYAELEGPTDWIDRSLAALGIDPAVCLTDSYGKLFLDWKERTGSPANHLTFSEIAASELVAR
jgi:adenylate cyclase class 2